MTQGKVQPNCVPPVLHFWLYLFFMCTLQPAHVISPTSLKRDHETSWLQPSLRGSVYIILFFIFAVPPLCSLSKAWRGEELGQQPWACHCFTAFEWFSPLPHVCVVFPLSDSALPLCLPFAPPLFWSLIISLSTQSLLLCKSVPCPTLLCSVSFPVFPFICLWMLPVVYCVQLCNHYSQYQSL